MIEQLIRNVAEKYGKTNAKTLWFIGICENKNLSTTYIFIVYNKLMRG